MAHRFKPSQTFKDCDVTDQSVYRDRRNVIKSLGFAGLGALMSQPASAFGWFSDDEEKKDTFRTRPLEFSVNENFKPDEALTPEAKVTSYNNFYEFGTDKSDPVNNAQQFSTEPWTLKVDGLVEKPLTLNYDDLFTRLALEERIYRLRCVEAWSMVIPWTGFQLSHLLAEAKPLSSAKYVAFKTLFDPEQMPGQRSRFTGGGIDYPYVEGLRIDEATHPLTMLATGVYGKSLPPQNGAPVRLVVPWKYGFKSIKSIVSITLTDKEPPTTWKRLAHREYGFYANVNPAVDHPRWSQASERRITSGGLFNQNRIPTRPFNGYQEVASLYSGMDLSKFY